MKSHTQNADNLSERIILGVRNAVRKMIEERALAGDAVMVGDAEEGFKYLPAQEVLESLNKSDQALKSKN